MYSFPSVFCCLVWLFIRLSYFTTRSVCRAEADCRFWFRCLEWINWRKPECTRGKNRWTRKEWDQIGEKGKGEKTTPAAAEALLTERRNLADGQPQLLCAAYCAARGSERWSNVSFSPCTLSSHCEKVTAPLIAQGIGRLVYSDSRNTTSTDPPPQSPNCASHFQGERWKNFIK